jgi:hypothetical protein
MSAPKTERRKYDEEFMIKLAVIETRQTNVIDELQKISKHLSDINGSIVDYQVTKEKLTNACLKLTALDADVSTMNKLVSNIKTKVWSVAAFVGIICGGVGTAVAFVIQRFGGV